MKWKRTDPEPTPEQLAAWADGELGRAEAERVEAWLRSHPAAAQEALEARRITRLYSDHPPAEPSDRAWQGALAAIEDALARPRVPARPRWPLRLVLGLTAAAALLAGVVLARSLWTARPPEQPLREVVEGPRVEPPAPEDEEPFPVAAAGEVNVLSIDAADADRVLMGQPLFGTFEVASPEDIEIVEMEPHPEDGRMPRLQRGPEVPMIVVASAGGREP
jgi:anti-sigma factor RsiW